MGQGRILSRSLYHFKTIDSIVWHQKNSYKKMGHYMLKFISNQDPANIIAAASLACTIIIALIQIFQNRRYNKEADKINNIYLDQQEIIKNLKEKNVFLMKSIKKIEVGLVSPVLIELPSKTWREPQTTDIEEDAESAKLYIVPSINDLDPDLTFADLSKKYYSFTFYFENTGEKTIRNFSCRHIYFNDNDSFEVLHGCNTVDIYPGQTLECTLFSRENYAVIIEKGKINQICFIFRMYNTLHQEFEMYQKFLFFPMEENPMNDYSETSDIYEVTDNGKQGC